MSVSTQFYIPGAGIHNLKSRPIFYSLLRITRNFSMYPDIQIQICTVESGVRNAISDNQLEIKR